MESKYMLAAVIWVVSGIAIAVACYSTKSAAPIWGLLFPILMTEELL